MMSGRDNIETEMEETVERDSRKTDRDGRERWQKERQKEIAETELTARQKDR